jgi:hypothetical protein
MKLRGEESQVVKPQPTNQPMFRPDVYRPEIVR